MIIGISGKRGVGKTHAAVHLARSRGYVTVPLAYELKKMAGNFFPFTSTDFSVGYKEKPYKDYDWSPRDFLISLGELGRFYDEDFWIKKSGIPEAGPNVVVDDVRFPNEAKYIKSIGGKIIRLERFENLNVYGKNLDISSETSLDDYQEFDYTIAAPHNVKLNELYSSVDKMMLFFAKDKLAPHGSAESKSNED